MQQATAQRQAGQLLAAARTLASQYRMDMVPARAARMQAQELRAQAGRVQAQAPGNFAVAHTLSSVHAALAPITCS